MKLNLNLKKILCFLIIFITLTIIGTLSHELSHYISAKLIGLNPVLHYGFVTFDDNFISNKDYFISTLFGPIQTVLFGSIGFAYIYKNKNKYAEKLSLIDWIAFFLSLFWLRECFNLFKMITLSFFVENYTFSGDEVFISNYLNLHPLFLNSILGIIGFIICYISTFIILPKKYLSNLVIGGIIGSIIGYLIWFHFLGEKVLP